jgi:hypothetical protein
LSADTSPVNYVFPAFTLQHQQNYDQLHYWTVDTVRTYDQLKGRYTLDIFTHNISIETYCNKKYNSMPRMSKGQGKLLTKFISRYITFFSELTLVVIETCDSKLTNYCDVFLSFYRNIVRKNV